MSVVSASRFVGHLAFLRGKVQELEEYALVWGSAKQEESTEDTKIVEAVALKAGVEERRVRLAESQGAAGRCGDSACVGWFGFESDSVRVGSGCCSCCSQGDCKLDMYGTPNSSHALTQFDTRRSNIAMSLSVSSELTSASKSACHA